MFHAFGKDVGYIVTHLLVVNHIPIVIPSESGELWEMAAGRQDGDVVELEFFLSLIGDEADEE